MAANWKGPMDYVDVATRIVEFRAMYPEGRLRQRDVKFIDFAGKSWVVYTAEAWRTPDDPAPAHGTAWEPVPGPTQFTKDSELQNAETAAWGRAMVAALAVDTKKGIASAEEVRNRQEKTPPAHVDLAGAVARLTAAPTHEALRAVWEGLSPAEKSAPQVVAAKDTRKEALTSPGVDAWATAEVKP